MNKIVYIDIGLQIWGGIGYLLAKILLAAAESRNDSRKLRVAGWSSYLVSVPAWIILMVSKNDWLVAGTDIGSIPSMILGVVVAWKRDAPVPKFFDVFAKIITYLMIALGFIYSIYYFHGIKTFTQILEILITIAFLLGSYLLAKQKPGGWLLFMLSGVCMIILLLIQSRKILIFQQVVSLIVEIIGYIKAIKRYKLKNNENKNI